MLVQVWSSELHTCTETGVTQGSRETAGVCVCVCACVRACVCVCVRACVRACVRVYLFIQYYMCFSLVQDSLNVSGDVSYTCETAGYFYNLQACLCFVMVFNVVVFRCSVDGTNTAVK